MNEFGMCHGLCWVSSGWMILLFLSLIFHTQSIERAWQGLMRPKRLKFYMPVLVLIRRILHVINLFVWRSVSLWSTVFYFYFDLHFDKNLFIFLVEDVKMFIFWIVMFYVLWDASQCALLIGWKKGLTCPSPVEHTNQ